MTDSSATTIAALLAQLDWLRVTLSSIGDAVITTDCDERVTFLNPVAESLTGWPLAEAVGQPLSSVFRLINEENRLPVESPTVKALREARTVKLATHSLLVAKDGTERPLDDSAAPICKQDGEVVGVVLIFRDITARRMTERALDRALAYADDVIDTLREPFIVLDTSLRIKTANRAFYTAFQATREETEGHFLYELGNGQWDIPSLRELLDRVASSKEPVEGYEIAHSFPTIGRKRMLLNARPFPVGTENPEMIMMAVEDVSALHERAEDLVTEGRHKDEFLAVLAHELRNPLAPIGNAVQCLGMAGMKEDDIQAARDVIARQMVIMVRLVDDLLDVARMRNDKLELRKQPIDLASVIASVVEATAHHIVKYRHEMTVSLPPEPVELDGDPVRLVQIFQNLVNNAAKYTPPGGHIAITAERQGLETVIAVRDDGIGIPPDMLTSIFDIFTQVDRSLERRQGGLGIGLTLVRRLVEMHDGSIVAHSEGLGRGSEFVVRLPLLIRSPLDAGKTPAAAVSALTGRRILVVDDNRDSADSLGILLRMRGNEIRLANDGVAALEAAEAFRPDLMLLDIGLPKLNGYEVARRIRQEPWGKDIVLVALTGWGQDEDRRKSHDAGFNLHVVKPVELSRLETLLTTPQPV